MFFIVSSKIEDTFRHDRYPLPTPDISIKLNFSTHMVLPKDDIGEIGARRRLFPTVIIIVHKVLFVLAVKIGMGHTGKLRGRHMVDRGIFQRRATNSNCGCCKAESIRQEVLGSVFVPGVKIPIKNKSAIKNKKNALLVLAWNFYKDIKKNNIELSDNFINIKELESSNWK